MSFSLQTHEYEVDSVTMVSTLKRVNPYIRLTKQGETPVFLQGGQFFSENGEFIENVPAWVASEFQSISDAALLEAGFAEPEPHAPTVWQCTECGASVPLKSKGLHIGRHVKYKKMMEKIT